jgi:hypothetical protein
MAKNVRRHMAKVQLSIAAGALGLLAGVGLGKGTAPAQVDADPAAHNVITINGTNIRDGSVKFKDLDKRNIQKFLYLKPTVNKLFRKERAFASDIFAKLNASDALIIKNLADFTVKLEQADSRFVNGDGSVFTGSQLVNDTKETLLTVPNTLRVEASTPDQGKNATLTLTNLASVEVEYASNAPAQGGGTQHGNLAPGNSTAILIGLLTPATVQVIPGAGDGGGVHTFTFTAYGETGGQVQVVGQALSR